MNIVYPNNQVSKAHIMEEVTVQLRRLNILKAVIQFDHASEQQNQSLQSVISIIKASECSIIISDPPSFLSFKTK